MAERNFFEWYQYLSPLVLTPLSFWLWWRVYDGAIILIMVAWFLPILFAYIVPGVGTNFLKVWEFDTRFRLGKFRPHHGFVFGSATSMLIWLVHVKIESSFFGVLQLSLIAASVLGFWNVIYDILILKSGILKVYNQPWADGLGEEAIAMDYAPVFFGGFGAVYGAGIGFSEILYGLGYLDDLWINSAWFMLLTTLCIAFPVWLYRVRSFKNHGHSGCKPIKK